MDSPDPPPDLQFDTTASREGPIAPAPHDPLRCATCQTALDTEYFDANGQSICRACSETIARHIETPRGIGVLGRAVVFGGIAAILGAVLYFAVLAISGFEIGLVAIAIGYMVGYGVRLGTRGRGGRRFQILAVVLTYWALGLAYSSLTFQSMIQQRAQRSSATVSSPATPKPAARSAGAVAADAQDEPDHQLTGAEFARGVLQLLVFTVVLPVLVVAGSLPGGLISAAIMAFGMLQAWRMTAAPRITVSGPYRIGSAAAAPAG